MIEKVAKTEFLKNVTHKPLKLNPSKNPRLPSLRVEQAPGREAEITEEGATQSAATDRLSGRHQSDRC
jgi:hypothetical protein